MLGVESIVVDLAMRLFEIEAINAFFRDPRTTARIVGICIALAGGTLGTFLLLRGMALTSDAISHTVLLGIVVAFMIMRGLPGAEPDLASPWLIIGAAAAGVATVILTELIHAPGLMKQDAALGLVFPLLFALAVIGVSRYVDDVHMDEDAVMVGEIGVAWANTNSHCLGECEEITIGPEDPRAEITRQCTNCREEGISPRDPRAEFTEICTNCGTYSPGEAWQAGLLDRRPLLVYWPKSITVTAVMAVLTILFIGLLYKELKISTFDPGLAHSLGLKTRPLNYALMVVVSLVAVAAFDAVGSILVIAFFIIPPAAAYLLTSRLSIMLLLSGVFGGAGAYWGYDLARGRLFGTFDLPGEWDTSISASMVLMMLLLFAVVLLLSPRFGILSAALRRVRQRGAFMELLLLGHLLHEGRAVAIGELRDTTGWSDERLKRVVDRLTWKGQLRLEAEEVRLTTQGRGRVERFRREQLAQRV
ncbi:MAG: metal ABC transporter permease [Alkalispirochaetaceae bacterium]